jgi:hypothetical protein
VHITADGAEPIQSNNELSIGGGMTPLDGEKGVKLDLLADQPILTGKGVGKSLDVGHTSTQRDGRGGSTKIGVQVGVGGSIEINWAAVADLARQAKDHLTGAN